MWDGRIEQTGRPDELYSSPATLHAAGFIGDANVLSFAAENAACGRRSASSTRPTALTTVP